MRFQRLKEEEVKIRKEIRERTIGYILAAFSFVAGLAWNEAIKSFIDLFFPSNKNSIFIKFIYALVVTVIVVMVTAYLVRKIEKKDK